MRILNSPLIFKIRMKTKSQQKRVKQLGGFRLNARANSNTNAVAHENQPARAALGSSGSLTYSLGEFSEGFLVQGCVKPNTASGRCQNDYIA